MLDEIAVDLNMALQAQRDGLAGPLRYENRRDLVALRKPAKSVTFV